MDSTSPVFTKILFIFALEKEALPLQRLLSLPQDAALSQNPLLSAYHGTYQDLELSIVHPKVDNKFNVEGIGPENAAVVTYISSRVYQPNLIISAGTCVVFPIEAEEIPFQIGDVCFSKEPIGFIDREIVLDSFRDYMYGKYEILELPRIFEEMGFKPASIGTTSCFHDFSAENSKRKRVFLQEMEAAAVAKIAFIMRVPFLALKIVASVNYGKELIEDITKNFFEHVAEESELLAVKIKQMLEKMAFNKKL